MKSIIRNMAGVPASIVLLVFLYHVSTRNYLLFHILVESASILIAFAVFIIAFNTRHFLGNHYLLFLGIVFPFVGTLDFLHTLAYKGMGVFPGAGSNLAAQIWIQARYLHGISLAVAPLFLYRKIRVNLVLLVYTVVLGLLLLSVFTFGIFPDCYIDPQGLTTFKIYSEYAISAILVISLALLARDRDYFTDRMFLFVAFSIVATIASELSFTLYTDVYGLTNAAGHLLKVLAFYLVYKGLIEAGLVEPYSGLFTNLKSSEEDLRRAQEELKRKNEQLESFVYTAGHDLRTPLTSAQGYVQLLKRRLSDNISRKDRKILDIILSSLTHLSVMIKDLLDFAYLGEKSKERKLVDLENIINGIAVEKREEIARLGVEIAIHDDVPFLYMSETRAYQVFANLISNSLKFFREDVAPLIEIGIEKVCDAEKPESYEGFYVRDNGTGMTEEVRNKAFDMFYTTDDSGNVGTGAGLAIVRKIVENESGSIRIESSPGKGATFYLLLPVRRDIGAHGQALEYKVV